MTKTAVKRASFPQALKSFTERILTLRLKKKLRERMKQQRRNPVLDWIYAILWAACVVLVINQYVFQNYRIPSESMVDTLLVGDMIFVDKFSFGPELLPGMAKLPGLASSQRGQIIVFENPSYLSKGPVFTIAQQMLYMLTLTLVDIDRDENGEQQVHYLIKRQVGAPGDRIKVERGEVFIAPEGTSDFIAEPKLMKELALTRKAHRLVAASDYGAIEGVGAASAYQETGLKTPASLGSTSIQAAYKTPSATTRSGSPSCGTWIPRTHGCRRTLDATARVGIYPKAASSPWATTGTIPAMPDISVRSAPTGFWVEPFSSIGLLEGRAASADYREDWGRMCRFFRGTDPSLKRCWPPRKGGKSPVESLSSFSSSRFRTLFS
jgi:signal peptidase I